MPTVKRRLSTVLWPLRRGSAENAAGDVSAMVALLRAAGLDGVFTDDPGLVVPALNAGD